MSSSVMPWMPSACAHGRSVTVRSRLRRRFRPGRSSAPARRRPAHSIVSSAAARLHVDPRVEPAEADAGDHRGAGAGAAGQRLAGAALVHAQADLRCASTHLHEAGVDPARKARVRSRSAGPAWRPARCRRRRRSCTACGLPIDSTATSTMRPRRASSGQSIEAAVGARGASPAASNGTRAGSKIGAPMSTVTRPSARRRSSSTLLMRLDADRGLVASGPCRARSARSSARRCRTARPRRRRRCRCGSGSRCPACGAGSTTRIWSAPTPKRRSASARYLRGVERERRRAWRRARRSRCRRPASW